jgi:hypothetical protein
MENFSSTTGSCVFSLKLDLTDAEKDEIRDSLTLIVLGEKLDSAEELEKIPMYIPGCSDELGFDAYLVYKDGPVQQLHNLTEFHHLFDARFKESAFESDIHTAGLNVRVTRLSCIIITQATELAQSF